MPCRWVTIKGRRVKLGGRVGAPTAVIQIAAVTAAVISGALAQIAIFHSPRITPEEARDAGVRVWFDEEKGYFAEARLRPGATPIYTALTPEQATNLKGPVPDPALVARLFERKEPAAA